jgi:hypothetical protein
MTKKMKIICSSASAIVLVAVGFIVWQLNINSTNANENYDKSTFSTLSKELTASFNLFMEEVYDGKTASFSGNTITDNIKSFSFPESEIRKFDKPVNEKLLDVKTEKKDMATAYKDPNAKYDSDKVLSVKGDSVEAEIVISMNIIFLDNKKEISSSGLLAVDITYNQVTKEIQNVLIKDQDYYNKLEKN